MSTLLEKCALVALYDNDDNYLEVACFRADGTVNGTIVRSPNSIRDNGQVAASIADDRIYAMDDDDVLHVFDGEGATVTTVAMSDTCYALYVPEAGKLWVSHEAPTNAIIKEYTKDGVYIRDVATITDGGPTYLQPYEQMVKVGTFLYFNALNSGAGTTRGIWKYDLVNGGNCTQVVASALRYGLSRTPGGDLLTTPVGSGATVTKYSTAGVSLDTYTLDNEGGGSSQAYAVAANEGGSWWVANLIPARYQSYSSAGILLTSFPFISASTAIYIITVPYEVRSFVPTALPQPPGECLPPNQVGNGGKGESGCNVGGYGWTSSWTGSIGTIPNYDDPIPGESLEGKSPDIWAEIDL